MRMNISAAILAGGENKRFGGITKANIVVDGEKIISRIINAIDGLFYEIFIVTNSPEEFSEEKRCKIVSDLIEKSGPLGGIHAALKNASGEAVFVIAADMPFPEKGIIESLLQDFEKDKPDAVIPETGNLIEPLYAIYNKSIFGHLEKYLTENRSRAVHDFLLTINSVYLPFPEGQNVRRAFSNINSPGDLKDLNV